MKEPLETEYLPASTRRSEAEEVRAMRRHRRFVRRKALILRGTAVLPALCTLLNGLCGFWAIYLATIEALGEAKNLYYQNLWSGACLIFAAMVFDVLDGRLARWTKRASEFGAQLDSLCDAISFGVAPAILMLRTVITVLRGHVDRIGAILPDPVFLERAVWCVAALYMACAILRLARFNVENEPDESSHMSFKGLPSPAAAAVVASLVLLFAQLNIASILKGWMASSAVLVTVSVVLPIATLLSGLLMVSRFRYPHVINQYIRGKKPFSYLVKLVVVVLAAWLLEFYVTAAVVTLIFAMSGPIGAIWRKFKKPKVEAGMGQGGKGANPPA